jgi:DNA-binding GntR family transcriptional regulator
LSHKYANKIVNNLSLLYIRPMSEGHAYETLHNAIVTGALSPGERLVEEELADRLGLTRGAVRAALLRLSHDGLVTRERNRGAHVRRVSISEAIEIVEARCALESLAAGYAALRRTDEEAAELRHVHDEMRALHAEGELLAMSERNAVLHRRILDISRHQVAIEVCCRLRSQVVRFQFRTVLAPGRAVLSLAEHEAVVDAIESRDRDRAERAMRTHLAHVAQTLAELANRERVVA